MKFVTIETPGPRDVVKSLSNIARDVMPGIGSMEIYFHKKLGHKVLKLVNNDLTKVTWGFFTAEEN